MNTLSTSMVRMYHLVSIHPKTGMHTRLTRWPMPHKQCCTMKSKGMNPANVMLVEYKLDPGEYESLPAWIKDDIGSAID